MKKKTIRPEKLRMHRVPKVLRDLQDLITVTPRRARPAVFRFFKVVAELVSADGTRLTYLAQRGRVFVSVLKEGEWSKPIPLKA